MKLYLYSIYDLKAEIYLSPFPTRSDTDAKRQITASYSDPQMRQTPLFTNPDDFMLYSVGTFDDETGSIVGRDPVPVATIRALIPPAQLPS